MEQKSINISGAQNYISQNTMGQTPIFMGENPLPQLYDDNSLKEIESKLRKIKKLGKAIRDYLVQKNKVELQKSNEDKNILKFSDLLFSEEQLFIERINKYLENVSGLRNQKTFDENFNSEISKLIVETNLIIDEIGYYFSYIISITEEASKFIETGIKNIGHSEYINDANQHYLRIINLEKQIDFKELYKDDFEFLSDKGTQIIILCTVIEENRNNVEQIIINDRKKQSKTKKIVTRGILSIILFFGITIGLIHQELIPDLTTYKLPLLNIPLPIIIWGFIGSLASMNYRFNERPVHDFGDTLKWLVTRPTQGIILSSGFYLALKSGLFLLATDTNAGSNEVFLFLAFLIGFSDKFVDRAFKLLVDRFISTDEDAAKKNG